MKKVVTVTLSVVFFIALAGYGIAELRPAVKVMMTRLGWLGSMTANFALSDFEKIKGDAGALADQAKKAGERATGPSKDANIKLYEAATALSDAADKKDGALTATRIGEVLGACYNCHSAARDK